MIISTELSTLLIIIPVG